MSYAIVRNSDADPHIVGNSVLNSAGAPSVVSVDVLDVDANPFTVFSDSVTGIVPKVIFVATSDRTFVA